MGDLVEIDRGFARSLSRQMTGKNVTVVEQDATALKFPDSSFDGALCFTLPHQVPSMALQNRITGGSGQGAAAGRDFRRRG